MLGASAKCNLACEAGCGSTASCSDHARIGRALEVTIHVSSPRLSHILDGLFSWQVEALVSLDTDTCSAAQCK